MLCSTLWMMSGLKTFSSKLPDAPPMPTATSFPITCAHTIVMASDCVGFTLPGMMELPGSFSGIVISPRPDRGPEASQRTSLAIFMSAVASVFSAPCNATSASWPASAANLLGADTNGRPVSSAIFFALRSAYSGCVLRPVPTAVPPSASSYTDGQRVLHRTHGQVELRDPAGDFLAQRQGRRVLQMRAADFHDVRERLRFGVERRAERGHARPQVMHDLFGGGDVHRRRERVVRRLTAIDVVVRVDRLLAAHHAAGHLDRAVRDDLVRVHVRLRAAARLPDEQREVVVELPVDHLVCRRDDELDLIRRQRLQVAVHERRGLLQDAERADHRPGKMLGADVEVMKRSLRLRAPVAVGGDGDLAHGVGFFTGGHKNFHMKD